MSAESHRLHARYLRLREGLMDAPGVYTELSAIEQWEVFGYYIPHERVGPAGLALHQLKMRLEYPSLEGRADQSYRKIARRFGQWREPLVQNVFRSSYQALRTTATAPQSVLSKKNPQPDLVRVAEGMMQLRNRRS